MPKFISGGFSLIGASLAFFGLVAAVAGSPEAQGTCVLFPETKRSVCGRFLEYWQENGALSQLGYPLTGVMRERSEANGYVYDMQYFERAVFELHPENQPPYDVLLSLLGTFEYQRKYGTNGAPKQIANEQNPYVFKETGKTIGGRFRAYWEQNGGLARQGLPISDEFDERSDLNQRIYRVQYFERAVFELHPENQPPYDVLLSQVGTMRFRRVLATCGGHTRLTGFTIAEVVNSQPETRFELRGYRVEAVTLPAPITCAVRVPSGERMITQTRTFEKFWRVAITGDKLYYPTALPWYIWFDDTLVGTSNAGSELVAFVYDKALLKEGAAVGISYGIPNPDVSFSQKLTFTSAP